MLRDFQGLSTTHPIPAVPQRTARSRAFREISVATPRLVRSDSPSSPSSSNMFLSNQSFHQVFISTFNELVDRVGLNAHLRRDIRHRPAVEFHQGKRLAALTRQFLDRPLQAPPLLSLDVLPFGGWGIVPLGEKRQAFVAD